MDLRLSEKKTKASAKTNDICGEIENALVHTLVQAYRAGMEGNKADLAFKAIIESVEAAKGTYYAAIAQPGPRIAPRQRVIL